jgi:hypothetical protein
MTITHTELALQKAGFTKADLKSPDSAVRNAAWDVICPPMAGTISTRSEQYKAMSPDQKLAAWATGRAYDEAPTDDEDEIQADDKLEELSLLQGALSRVDGYCNHTKEGLNGVLGTGHALYQVGRISEDDLGAFVKVARIILAERPE